MPHTTSKIAIKRMNWGKIILIPEPMTAKSKPIAVNGIMTPKEKRVPADRPDSLDLLKGSLMDEAI